MRRAISYCVQKVLRDNKRVYLKGIGTLRISNYRKKNYQVTKLVLYQEKKSSNKQLIKFIEKEYTFSKKHSSHVLGLYNKIILKKLKKHSLVTIPSVAVLSKNGDEIIIKSLIDKRSEIKSKKKAKGQKASILATSSPIVEEVVDPTEIVISSSESVVKGAEVGKETDDIDQELLDELSYLDQLNHGVPQKDELKEVLKDHFYQEDEKALNVEMPEPIDNTKYVKPLEPKLAHVDTSSHSFNYKPWIIGALSLFAFAFLVYLGSSMFIQPKTNVDDSPTLEIGQVDTEETPPIIDNKEVDLGSTPSLEKCIIITGSYSQIRNEEERRNLILKKGYTPYTETHNGLTRVGIELDCTEENAESILFTVRESIDDKAWLLYPPDLSI